MFKLSFYKYTAEKGAHFWQSAEVEKALCDYTGRPCKVYTDERGKPLCEGVYLSISHTDGTALLAISDDPIGVDIERLDREIHIDGVTVWDWTDAEATAKLTGMPVRAVLKKTPENISIFQMEKDGLAISMAEYKTY